jgi:HAD superfamily hydrolase (TIGR01509 family)
MRTIESVVFDLDGVLCKTPELHYVALNKALEYNGYDHISFEEHNTIYNGLSTRQKLDKLNIKDANVFKRKQEETLREMTNQIMPDPRLRKVILSIKHAGIKVACVSNCIRETQQRALYLLGLLDLFDCTICNEDVTNPKPSPEMYNLCFARLEVKHYRSIIVEDSPIGLQAAKASKAKVIQVENPDDVTLPKIFGFNLPHLVIPMAGQGIRFQKAGYTIRKPFIDVKGECMIQAVHSNLDVPEENTTFVVLDEDYEKVSKLFPKACVVSVGASVTKGTAITVQSALDTIQDDCPIMVANCDQIIEVDMGSFFIKLCNTFAKGGILTFHAPDKNPKWSYVDGIGQHHVQRVAEKDPISSEATVGVYWWYNKDILSKAIEDLVKAKDVVNGEYYLCPTFNYTLPPIIRHRCVMHSIGVPEDLDKYLNFSTPKYISHRANTIGPNPETENCPEVIEKVHKDFECDVEIDVWVTSKGIELGHDSPKYKVDLAFLKRPWLWCHAKNEQALQMLLEEKIHCFYHGRDDHTITSRGIVWTYPSKPLVRNGVAVKPEGFYTYSEIRKAAYVCSDYADPKMWCQKK